MIEFPLRPSIDLNRGWEFTRAKVPRSWLRGEGPAAERVDLPHCWNADDTYQFDRSSYKGHGAYRRWVELPEGAASGSWRLRTHGFYGPGELWLNGRRVTRFDPQFLGLDIPLPPSLGTGPHLLAIRLDNLFHHNVLPGRKLPDFLLYGGLAGGARLERMPWPHIEERTVEIACRTRADGSELVELATAVANPHGAAAGCLLRWRITDDRARAIAESDCDATGGFGATEVVVADPRCWSPDHPHLYHAEGRLELAGDTVDAVDVRFGITRAGFRPDEGFFLDGERVDLHGANRHESIPGLGSALTPELNRGDARHLKRLGANLVRLSHYPQHPAFLDACDELGIMVYPEIATWKSVRTSRGWRRAAVRQMRDLIRRDRHHPSVILWGMGNESRSRTAYLELRDLVRDLDPERPTTYAENHLYRAQRRKTTGIPDVWGVNYELDVLSEARDAARLRTVLVSECCNHPRSVRGDELEELRQVALMEREWEILADRPYVAGFAVWSLADYATEYRRRTRRQTGLLDAWRRPKMAAELFRARYSPEPFISLICVAARLHAPASRFRTELADPHGGGSDHRLHIFSNCEGIRIVQGGELLVSMEKTPHGIVPVDLSRGDIVAEGFASGITVTGSIRRWGAPEAVRLRRSSDFPFLGELTAVDVDVVDAHGTTVPSFNGHVLARGSGGAEVLAYTAAGEVLISRGEGRFFVRATPEASAPEVTVTAGGLTEGVLILGAVDDPDPTEEGV